MWSVFKSKKMNRIRMQKAIWWADVSKCLCAAYTRQTENNLCVQFWKYLHPACLYAGASRQMSLFACNSSCNTWINICNTIIPTPKWDKHSGVPNIRCGSLFLHRVHIVIPIRFIHSEKHSNLVGFISDECALWMLAAYNSAIDCHSI